MSAATETGPSSTSVVRQVVPKATFLEDIPAFVKESDKGVDELLAEVQSTLQRYVSQAYSSRQHVCSSQPHHASP